MKSGEARITTAQIGARIDAEVRGIPHVARCTSTVSARGNRIEVVLDLDLHPGAALSQTADAACARAQALVERQLGIALAGPPRARLHYRELRLRADAPPAPAAASGGRERPPSPEEAREHERE